MRFSIPIFSVLLVKKTPTEAKKVVLKKVKKNDHFLLVYLESLKL